MIYFKTSIGHPWVKPETKPKPTGPEIHGALTQNCLNAIPSTWGSSTHRYPLSPSCFE